jgi:hypothetical protein
VAPQKLGSDCGSTQVPPQTSWLPGQLVTQAPLEQTWPEAHTVPAVRPVQSPEAPQKARSVWGFTQALLQTIWPAGQLVAQRPFEQTWPETQVVPAVATEQAPEAPQ